MNNQTLPKLSETAIEFSIGSFPCKIRLLGVANDGENDIRIIAAGEISLPSSSLYYSYTSHSLTDVTERLRFKAFNWNLLLSEGHSFPNTKRKARRRN